MKLALPVLILAMAAPSAWAAPIIQVEPGLDVEDACMAEALRESGYAGPIRVRMAAGDDDSLEACDLDAETGLVGDYRAVAGPCMADPLRDLGYLGRFVAPRGGLTEEDLACLQAAAPAPAPTADDLITFRGADGRDVTTMRPIPNPD